MISRAGPLAFRLLVVSVVSYITLSLEITGGTNVLTYFMRTSLARDDSRDSRNMRCASVQ